jgi:hypothetical protein
MWYGGHTEPVTCQFGASQVSKLDCFHPSLAGRALLASLTWQRSCGGRIDFLRR